jgi:aminoglycoside phosphotransferase (APT) family kinase protein
MEEIEGKTLREVMRDASQNKTKFHIQNFCKIFNELHDLDLNTFPRELPGVPETSTSNFLKIYFKEMTTLLHGPKLDFLTPILSWLKKQANNISIEKISVIHGDFHPDNILVNQNGEFYVIDWSASLLADFRYDLAWSMLLAKLYIGEGFKKTIFNNYEELRTKTIKNIDFFMVIAILRRLSDITRVIALDSQETGMREGTSYIIKSQKELISRLSDLLYDYTNIKLNFNIL